MFPKSVSGTSGKRRENKVDDMTEGGANDAMLRENLGDVVRHLKNGVYLSCMADSAYAQSIIWASERIAELESQTQSPETGSDENRGLFFRLGGGCELNAITYCKAVAWGQNRIRHLERVLRDEQEVVGEIKKLKLENERLSLENENLSKTILAISNPPLLDSPQTDEEIHQQRRRERMLDKITLFCVTFGFDSDDGTLEEWAILREEWQQKSSAASTNTTRSIDHIVEINKSTGNTDDTRRRKTWDGTES